jgi:hypothetical protein
VVLARGHLVFQLDHREVGGGMEVIQQLHVAGRGPPRPQAPSSRRLSAASPPRRTGDREARVMSLGGHFLALGDRSVRPAESDSRPRPQKRTSIAQAGDTQGGGDRAQQFVALPEFVLNVCATSFPRGSSKISATVSYPPLFDLAVGLMESE